VTPALNGNTRITLAPEASGSRCPHPVGGVKVTAFVDENGDGSLGGAEASSVRYVCYSAPGAAGTPSTTGLAALISLTI
jgi:hypothetical protein